MRILKKIDNFIIGRIFQPVVNFIWKLTGIDNFGLARFFAAVIVIHEVTIVVLFRVFESFLFIVLGVVFFLMTNTFEDKTENDLVNLARHDYVVVFWKISFLFFSFMYLYNDQLKFSGLFSNILRLMFIFTLSCGRPTGKNMILKIK